jgi:uncharacterized RDD family membrane protein YckC
MATNPYAPPRAMVTDVQDPRASAVPADRGTRLGATMLDGIIFLVMVYLPLLLAAIVVPTAARNQAAGTAFAVGGLATLVGLIVYCWLTIKYVLANGQTIAKRMLGIKVVRSDGTAASLGRIFWVRNVVNGLISLVPFYAFVDALFIFGESRQCLHDKLADTIVVKA